MLFHINVVAPTHINLWVAPVDMRKIPSIRVSFDRAQHRTIEAHVDFTQLKEWGWHATGRCGFDLNGETCPELAGARHVEIHDSDTNVLLYSRSEVLGATPLRLLALDYTIDQVNVLRDELHGRFQASYFGLDNMHHDVLRCTFDLQYTNSQYFHGNVLFKRYEDLISKNEFLRTILVVDPYIELAKRLLWLRRFAQVAEDRSQWWRVEHVLEPCLFAVELNVEDVAAMKKAFDQIEQKSFDWLANPLTRALSCGQADEKFAPKHWVGAIETLSRFDVVGHQQHWDDYAAMVFDALGIDAPAPDLRPIPAGVLQLAERLRKVKSVFPLIDLDLSLDTKVLSAIGQQSS
ncbi:MAG: hypothetical protein PGN34_00795 [Methylobacterium frigidaeris]